MFPFLYCELAQLLKIMYLFFLESFSVSEKKNGDDGREAVFENSFQDLGKPWILKLKNTPHFEQNL